MKNYSKLFIALYCFLCATTATAGVEKYESIVYGIDFVGIAPGNAILPSSIKLPLFDPSNPNAGWGSNFDIRKVTDKVSLVYNTASLVHIDFEFSLAVQLEIIPIDANYNTLPTINTSLKIDYNPAARTQFTQLSLFEFSDACRFEVTITNVSIKPGLSAAEEKKVAKSVYIKNEIIIERYYHFDYTDMLCVGDIFNKHIIQSNELELCWRPLPGAEEYDLEYTYVEDYDGNGSRLNKADLSFNFDQNSARVSITENCYRIPLVYEQGYIVYRVRGIGRNRSDLNRKLYGAWSCGESGCPTSCCSDCNLSKFDHFFQIPLTYEKDDFNWQVVTAFAEEGKRKDIVSHMDGTLRNRQSVTGLSSDNISLVAESIYDYQGRAAIEVLPTPVNNPTLQFYPNFNQNLQGDPYSKVDFDLDGANCDEGPERMLETNNGAAHYYSKYSDFLTQAPYSDKTYMPYIPNADGLPFVQTEWMPDNTGRVKRQGGAGKGHSLGSGHEVNYFYGTPTQIELDTLFGNNIGFASHYFKVMTIDANSQVSISFQDLKGNTIATALAGDPPDNVDALASVNKKIIQNDLLEFNQIDSNDYALVSEFFLLLDSKSDIEFEYKYSAPAYKDATCMAANVCYDCIYDLELKVENIVCGEVLYEYAGTYGRIFPKPPPPYIPGQTSKDDLKKAAEVTIDFHCDIPSTKYPPSATPFKFNIPNLEVGSYKITKRLVVNEEAANTYVDHFLNDPTNTCSNKYADFLAAANNQKNSDGCKIDCGEIELDLNDPAIKANLSPEELAELEEAKVDFCDTISTMCQNAYEGMLADVSPGGQYGKLDINTFDASAYWLSVYNTSNHFPGVGKHYRNGNLTFNLRGGGTFDPLKPTHDLEFFFNNFQEEWAHELVQFHPEYCLYERCRDSLANSEEYDAIMMSTATLDDADQAGYVNLNITAPSLDLSIFNNDPYFNQSNGPGNKPTHRNQIAAKLQNFTGAPHNFTLKQFAIGVVNCPNQMFSGNCLAVLSGNWSTDPVVRNEEWATYRALYITLKEKLEYRLRANFSIYGADCYNDCIGASPFYPQRNNFLNYYYGYNFLTGGSPFQGEFDDADQPCSRFTYRLYVGKQKRFPDANDIVPIPGLDIYNDPPQVIIDAIEGYVNGTSGLPKMETCDQCQKGFQFLDLLNELVQLGVGWYPYKSLSTYDSDLEQEFNIENVQFYQGNSFSPEMVFFLRPPGPHGISCTINIYYEPIQIADIKEFCCITRTGNDIHGRPTFDIVATLSDGSKKTLQGYDGDCGICDTPNRCFPTPMAEEILNLLGYLMMEQKLVSPINILSDYFVGDSLIAYFANNNSPSNNFQWMGQLAATNFTGYLMKGGKQCEVLLDLLPLDLNKNIAQFTWLKPDYSKADANGNTFDFIIEGLYYDGTSFETPGRFPCLAVGKCCSADRKYEGLGITKGAEYEQQKLPKKLKLRKGKRKRKRMATVDTETNQPTVPIVDTHSGYDPLCHDCIEVRIDGGVLDSLIINKNGCESPLCNPPDSIITIPINENFCEEFQDELAIYKAGVQFQYYQDSLKKAVKEAYMLKCLAATEHYVAEYFSNQHHFTLYYYDQANNLVQTIPPNANVGLSNNEMATIKSYRKKWQAYRMGKQPKPQGLPKVYPDYRQWASKYSYNSLNQIRRQTIPDQGLVSGGQFVKRPTNFFYDEIGRLVLSQNPEQALGNRFSFTRYDALNRIILVGETFNNSPSLTYATLKDEYDLNGWVLSGDLNEVVETTYDRPRDPSADPQKFPSKTQGDLRGRISAIARYPNLLDWANGNYEHVSNFSYDIQGNVHTLVQDNADFVPKVIEYEYDLISGNVHRVHYQRGKTDAFHHKYDYDADNRLVRVFTSPDSCIWDRDAAYFYYPHGPMARIELGEDEVQGLDYAYTIHGWLKGMNSGSLQPDHDIGKDGAGNLQTNNQSPHAPFARDAVGFILNYYEGDYTAIGGNASFIPTVASSQFGTASPNLHNGNIKSMITAIKPFMDNEMPMGYTYSYDQLNRIKSLTAHDKFNPAANKWSAITATADYESSFSYDPNGNLTDLQRNGPASINLNVDQFKYNYPYGNNQLGHVDDDPAFTNNYDVDIDDQAPGNYEYDQLGNLTKDVSEGIQNIEWNAQGKVARISKTNGDKLTFQYDAMGNRISKTFNDLTTFYVLDANGNILSLYRRKGKRISSPQFPDGVLGIEELYWESAVIYGHKRLGIFEAEKCLIGCKQSLPPDIEGPRPPTVPNSNNQKH